MTQTATEIKTFVLGSHDGEMKLIEQLLREVEQPYLFALNPAMRRDPKTGEMVPVLNGAGQLTYRRVLPGEAAVAAGAVSLTGEAIAEVIALSMMMAVEVKGPWGGPEIDHHNNEKASWGPSQFLAASSLGQVIQELARRHALPVSWGGDFLETIGMRGVPDGHLFPFMSGWAVSSDGCFRVIPDFYIFEAAADHCLGAAFAGKCPNIDPQDGGPFWRQVVESKRRAFAPDLDINAFWAAVQLARKTLREAPGAPDLDPIDLAYAEGCVESAAYPLREEHYVKDLTHLPVDGPLIQATGERYPSLFQYGPLAAALEGLGYVVRIEARGEPALRVGGCGDGTLAGPIPIERWLNYAGVARGCYPRSEAAPRNLYGFPARGMAGGTLRPKA